MNDRVRQHVETVCQELADHGETVTFTAVSERAGIGRATLYRNPELRALVEAYRDHTAQPGTLSGIRAELADVRSELERLSATVSQHDKQLRWGCPEFS
jgi:AcrR family transcriptional regulator